MATGWASWADSFFSLPDLNCNQPCMMRSHPPHCAPLRRQHQLCALRVRSTACATTSAQDPTRPPPLHPIVDGEQDAAWRHARGAGPPKHSSRIVQLPPYDARRMPTSAFIFASILPRASCSCSFRTSCFCFSILPFASAAMSVGTVTRWMRSYSSRSA